MLVVNSYAVLAHSSYAILLHTGLYRTYMLMGNTIIFKLVLDINKNFKKGVGITIKSKETSS